MLPEIPPEIRSTVLSSNDPVQLAYFLGSILNLGVEEEQMIPFSAVTGEGRHELAEALLSLLAQPSWKAS